MQTCPVHVSCAHVSVPKSYICAGSHFYCIRHYKDLCMTSSMDTIYLCALMEKPAMA